MLGIERKHDIVLPNFGNYECDIDRQLVSMTTKTEKLEVDNVMKLPWVVFGKFRSFCS